MRKYLLRKLLAIGNLILFNMGIFAMILCLITAAAIDHNGGNHVLAFMRWNEKWFWKNWEGVDEPA